MKGTVRVGRAPSPAAFDVDLFGLRICFGISHMGSGKNSELNSKSKFEIKTEVKGGGRGRPPHTEIYRIRSWE